MPNFDFSLGQVLFKFAGSSSAMAHTLPKMELRLRPTMEMNDPRESDMWTVMFHALSTGSGMTDDEREYVFDVLKGSCHMACFVEDAIVTPDEDPTLGFMRDRMWSHYAEEYTGLCYMFDRYKLIHRFHTTPALNGFRITDAVRYESLSDVSNNYNDIFNISLADAKSGDFQSFMKKHRDKYLRTLYFTKNVDWSNECEYRFVLFREDTTKERYVKFSIDECLLAVIVGHYFPMDQRKTLQSLANKHGFDLYMSHMDNGRLWIHPFDINAPDTTYWRQEWEKRFR